MKSFARPCGQRIDMHEFVKRLVTAFGLILALVAVFLAGFALFVVCVVILAMLALLEWDGLCSTKLALWQRGLVLFGVLAWFGAVYGLSLFLGVQMWGLSALLLAAQLRIGFAFWHHYSRCSVDTDTRWDWSMWASGCVVVLMALIAGVLGYYSNKYLFFYTIALTGSADTMGYLLGKWWKVGQPFARLSMNKTWSGTIAMLCAPCVVNLAVWLFVKATLAGVVSWRGFGVGLIALWGDLWISLLKRYRGVKHTGTLLPGHGGVLDRLDSHIMVQAWFFLLGGYSTFA